MKLKLFTFSFLLLAISSFAQEVGNLPLTKLTEKDGEQFKSNVVSKDKFGTFYSGGDDEIRILKGNDWQSYYDDGRPITELALDYNENIILGGEDYFGKLGEDSTGKFQFIDLSNNLHGIDGFTKLNKIIPYNDGTLFHIDNRIIKISDEITDYNFTDVEFSGKFNQNIIIQRSTEGFFIYAGNGFRKINGSEIYKTESVQKFIDLRDGRFIVFFERKIVMYDGDHFTDWRPKRKIPGAFKNAVYNQNGLFIQSSDQEIQQLNLDGALIRTIDLESEINHIYADLSDRLWISTDRGVSVIRTDSPFQLMPIEEEKGRVAVKINDKFYFGTNQGAYSTSWLQFSNSGFNRNYTTLLDAAVNDLGNFGGPFLIASDEGLFDQKKLISPEPFSNQLLFLEEYDVLIEASKSGLNLYEKNYNRWEYANHIYGLEEEVKQVVKDDNGRLWAYSSKSGIYLLDFDKELFTISPKRYELDQLPIGKINGIFLINGQPVISTYEGIYELNKQLDRFKKSDVYNDLLGENSNIQLLYQDETGDIWYISKSEVGLIRIIDKGVQKSAEKIRIPELVNYVNLETPLIYGLDSRNYLINGTDGFVKIDKAKIDHPEKLKISLYKVENTVSDELIFVKDPNKINTYEFYRTNNNVALSFSTNLFGSEETVEYAFSFNDKEWTEWSENSESNVELLGGVNSLKAKARVGMKNVSNTLVVPLIINQEWYYEDWAKYLVAAIGLLLFIIFIWIRTILFKRRRKKLDLLMKENDELKKVIKELTEKNAVISAQLLSAINESDINSQLKKLGEENDNPDVKKAIKKLTKKIKSDRKQPEEMMIDPDFMAKLKIKFPSLTKKDIRLCNLLKMDLTTKDIAPILDITVRGVEISRYRLRKKLELDNDVVLSDFLKKL